MKSFFHTLKVELVHQCRWSTHAEARQALFGHIEMILQQASHAIGHRVSYPRTGREKHGGLNQGVRSTGGRPTLDYLSPIDFERQANVA